MRGLIWVIGLAALAVALAVAGRYNEGFVLIQWPPYRIQLTANLFVLLLIVGFLLVYWMLRLVAHTLAMPSAVAAFRARRKSRAAQRAFERALTLLFEGRYGQALRQAESAYAAGHAPALTA
ncbi:MAG TPA: heme biosynthesis HemY N-terminal domain-containing protein, partial [Rhodocyclaceae bacterium]|nr:heme biosynthesis HemY N-terminal domain-containing protein [Rhodocyclaceae bacterium]